MLPLMEIVERLSNEVTRVNYVKVVNNNNSI